MRAAPAAHWRWRLRTVCSCSRTPCIRLFRRAAARPFSGRNPKREAEAADTLHITAQDLYSFGMIEGIIQEGTSSAQLIRNVARTLRDQLAELDAEPDIDTMLQKRYEKFRRVGVSEQ